jgi:hypothetical protein
VEPLALDHDLGAGDQHSAVLGYFRIEVGRGSDGPFEATAVAQTIVAPELPELLPAEGPPGLLVVDKVKLCDRIRTDVRTTCGERV